MPPSPQKPIHTQTFIDGLNTDLADDLIPVSMYRYGLNIHVLSTASGNKGIVTNCKGNVEVEFDQPEGENVTIGAREYTERNKFYFINWNENGYHTIYQYDDLLNKVTIVMQNLTDTDGVDIMQLEKRGLILHIDLVGDLFYWVDGITKAKKINIRKAMDKSSTGYGSVITEEYINAYKLAPIFAPDVNYFTDTTRLSNYLYGRLFKFSIRHIFDDGEKSNWSEYSAVALPQNESFSGNASVSNVNNALKVSVETGSKIVVQIEIAMQSTNPQGGILDFVSIATLDKSKLSISDNTLYDYTFYNDNASYSGVDQEKIIRAYSHLPKVPKLQAFTKNAMVYGAGREGFDDVEINVSATVSYTDLFLPDDTENEMNDPSITATRIDYDFTRKGGRGWRENALFEITIGHDVKQGNKFEMWGKNGESDNLYFTYLATNSDDAISVANAFKQQLIATGRILPDSEELPTTNIWDNTINGSGDVTFRFIIKGLTDEQHVRFDTPIPPRVNPVSFQTLKDNGQSILTHKSGGSVKYGILYWDEDTRRSLVYTGENLVVRTQFVTESEGFKKVIHRLSIKHQPPEWAKYWELVRTEDLTYGDWIQVLIQKAIDSQTTSDTDYVDLVIGSLNTYQRMHTNTVVAYDFQKNDRVRLISKGDSSYYDFLETVVLDVNDTIEDEKNEDVTTNGTSTVTIDGVTSEDNIGKYILINDVERQIIAAPSGTTYSLDRAITFTGTVKFPSYKLIDRRGTIRVRKPIGVDIDDNSLIEVYKPTYNKETAEKIFRLFDQKFAIVDWGTDDRAHSGNVQNQDPANPSTTPAIVDIGQGTSYVRQRELPTNNQIPGTQVSIRLIEDAGFSDFYHSTLNNNGKISVEDDGTGEKYFGSRLRFSNNYIEDTRINGLNDFDNTDREDYNDPYGDFKLLKFRDSFLFAFKELKTGYIPVLASIINDQSGQQILGTSSKLLNQLQYFSWEGGIGNNPESYSSDQTWQSFISPNSGTDCRVGGDGILPTSQQFGLDSKVREYIAASVKYGGRIFGGHDRENGERVIAFERYNEYIYNAGFLETEWKTFEDDLPEGTEYEVTTQPLNGDVVINGDDPTLFEYTPDTDYVGDDFFYYRWKVPGGEWTVPKKACIEVVEVEIPPEVEMFYNVELTVPFEKECSAGGGSTVNYVVPALKYSSPFSQEDADQQAQDDIDANGQNYANEHGTCPVTVNYSVVFGDDPTTINTLIIERVRGGVTTTILTSNGFTSGTLPAGSFVEGDTINAYQIAYAAFRWAPDSNANLHMDVDSVEYYDGDVTDQTPINLQNTPPLVIPNGTLVIDVSSTGSSTAVGYETFNLNSKSYIGNGEFSIDLTDNGEAGLGLQDLEPNNGDSNFSFNVVTDANDLTVTITNNKATAIDYSLAGDGGYLKVGTIAGMGNVSFADVPKSHVVVEVSDSSSGIACGTPTSYGGGQTYPTIQEVTLGSGTGTVTLDYNAISVPDKFIVMFDGVEVINTGYRGDSGQQSNLDAALATYGAPPETIAGTGSGTMNFAKGTATTVATVYVYAPISGTSWNFTLSCPV